MARPQITTATQSVSIEVEGKTYIGSFTVSGGVARVDYMDQSNSMELCDALTLTTIARMLLTEMVKHSYRGQQEPLSQEKPRQVAPGGGSTHSLCRFGIASK